MAAVEVIQVVNGEERTILIGEKLANDTAFMALHKLKIKKAIKMDLTPKVDPPKVEADNTGGEEPEKEGNTIDIDQFREDVLTMDNSALTSKYKKETLIAIAKELGLKGNLKGSGEESLINRCKAKLTEE